MSAKSLPRAVAVALVLALGACGGNDSPAEKAFGRLSGADEAQLRDWSRSLRAVPTAQATTLRALQEEDADAARSGVDRLSRAISEAGDKTLDFESGKLRRILQDYLVPIESYAATLERVVTSYEQEVESGIPTSDTVVNDLLGELQAAAERAQRGERRLANRLLDVMSPDQRTRFRAQVRSLQERFEEQATPSR